MKKPCRNSTCGEVHGYKWNRDPYSPDEPNLVEEPYLYCSIMCAMADGAYSVRTGWKQDRIKEVLAKETEDGPQECVHQTNPDGLGDGDCDDDDCRARMPHDRFHRYAT